ncbi:transcription antitermination factor NusB [Chlamydiota bacterium]
MEFPPQKFREIVFQLLFSFDMGGGVEAELIPFIMRELAVSKKNVSAAYAKAQAVWQNREDLDRVIRHHSKAYSLERIKNVEVNVLRLAFYELLIEKEQNSKIIISEAHRLTRKFSAIEGASFVNAVLDSLETTDESSPAVPSPERDASV